MANNPIDYDTVLQRQPLLDGPHPEPNAPNAVSGRFHNLPEKQFVAFVVFFHPFSIFKVKR
jgi:hypothetical protein